MESQKKPRHFFEKVEMPEGQYCVEEKCDCGAVRIRYASGSIAYINADGKRYPQSPSQCTTVNRGPIKYKTIKKFIPKESAGNPVEVLKEVVVEKPFEEKIYPNRRATSEVNFNTEARLREAIVTIKLMYEDMHKHDLRTKSRDIAGRLLESQGYKELIKYLDKKI